MKGHTRWVISVTISDDGKRIVSESVDKIVRQWDAQSGKAVDEGKEEVCEDGCRLHLSESLYEGGYPLPRETNCRKANFEKNLMVFGMRNGCVAVCEIRAKRC